MPDELCVLRWPEESDYALVERWLKPLSPTAALTGDAHEIVLAHDVRAANESGRIRYFMVDTPDGETIGVVNHRSVGSAGSYAIGGAVGDPGRWGAGAGAEALRLLVDLLFHQLNAHRVEFTTASFNRHTMSMLTRGGFVLEGVLRDFYFLDGEYHDRTIWSILRDEFVAGAIEHAAVMPVPDLVPARDKERARSMLVAHLAGDPPTSLRDIGDRAARRRPY